MLDVFRFMAQEDDDDFNVEAKTNSISAGGAENENNDVENNLMLPTIGNR